MSGNWDFGDDEGMRYLAMSPTERMEVQSRTFDAKKSCFVPDKEDKFLCAEIESSKGDQITARNSKGDVVTVHRDKCFPRNPAKFEMCEDMAGMSQLSEATVLHNLRDRAMRQLIYTYSGLFLICVNPFKRFPIYTEAVVARYKGKRRAEMPPHLFSIADNAYSFMLIDRENQSILITGESGAGKTENTKKVIAYFAMVTAGVAQDKAEGAAVAEKKIGLEEQIMQANPILEAYGNAKTVRNNNSSRFGKFVRIHFGPTGKIAGADVETYLLEKSRVTYQLPGIERNYHVFYWLLSDALPDYREAMLVAPDPAKYFYVNQGCLTVDNMDDQAEMRDTDTAFNVLGFSDEEKRAVYKCTGAVLNLGEMKFKQKGKEEQAEADGTAEAEKVSNLIGVNTADFLKSLLTPKVKVGNETVNKSQTVAQVAFAVNALSKCIFAKLFNYLVVIVNRSLDTKNKRQHFIGVLDIAGFEIFELNTLEQLLINYTNERLQQFFNHVMFVLEQEEYKKEGIVWEAINFGMDLQETIDLIEKPMGILDILQEQCLFPKATDETFIAKLKDQHLGKCVKFDKWKPDKKAKHEAHFIIAHYAGMVSYNIVGWLFKNKDPINDSVVEVMRSSKTPLIQGFFAEADDGDAVKKKKKRAPQTISAAHKGQLLFLVSNLKMTHPHFVRCIIPNEKKAPLCIDAPLVVHQLNCNGVLEGIRICRKGFPNRVLYPDFKQRYSILAPNAIPQGQFVDAKEATAKVLAATEGLDQDSYQCGNTKVFFKAGVLGMLEEFRDEKLGAIVRLFQAWIRGYLLRRNYKKLCDQRVALSTIQRNVRGWLTFKSWPWWKIFTLIKPLLSAAKAEDEMRMKEEEAAKVKAAYEELQGTYKQLEEQNVTLGTKIEKLQTEVNASSTIIEEAEEKIQNMLKEKEDLYTSVKEAESALEKEERNVERLEADKNKMEDRIASLDEDIENLRNDLGNSSKDNQMKDKKIENLQEELKGRDEDIQKLSKEKKSLQDKLKDTENLLATEEQKVQALNKTKQKLEAQIEETEDNLAREKKARADVEKAKRKLENDLKQCQGVVEELEGIKRDLEDQCKKKDNEIGNLNNSLEEANALIAKLQKKIKEQQRHIEELEEELEAERAGRAKAEKHRAELSRELDDLSSRLDEAGGATQAQVELNKRREAEVAKMKRELEESHLQSEQTIASMRKKAQDQVNELSEQVDNINKAKAKAEKERNSLKGEIDDLQGQLAMVQKQNSNASKSAKGLEGQLGDVNTKLEESQRQLQECTSHRGKMTAECNELRRQLEEAEANAGNLAKLKQKLSKELDEAKSNAEEEGRSRQKYQAEARALSGDLEAMRDQMEEEQEGRAEVQRMLQKAQAEASEWKRKCDSGEGGGMGGPEFDDFKRKMNAKIQEAQAQAETSQAKVAQVEKQKTRLHNELEDMTIEAERANALANQAEKKVRQVDRIVDEWKGKVHSVQQELDMAVQESRTSAAEVYRLRAQFDESGDTIEALRRENKNLADEIRDLTDQLSDGGKSVHELEKSRRRLEMEKEELQSALEEAEAALEQEEAKVQRAQLEVASIRQDIDRRLAEKDEEFEATRKNHGRALESLQATLEAESRGRTEALRMKKKLESDCSELEVALDNANRGRAEAEKHAKKYQNLAKEHENAVQDAMRERDDSREAVMASERRTQVLAGEIEELRTQLEAAERARKAAENELHDAADRVSELAQAQATANANKRKLETDIQAMQTDLEDQATELKSADETAKKAMADASRLADELRQEQDHAGHIEKMRRALESQVKELQGRLDEAEASSMKGGKRMLQKLETRIRELEVELDNEQRRHGETTKNMRKQERRLKELAFQADEDRKNQEKMQGMIDKLQEKIKTYKRQVEEAEEIAAVNLAKYRKVQHELEDAEERADMAENTLGKLRAKTRGASQTRGPSQARDK